MKLPAGEEIKNFPESQISFFVANIWLSLWMDVSGTDANGIAGCHRITNNTGDLKLQEM